MGAEDDVVSMIFCSLFENVINGEADQSHGFHFDPRGLNWSARAFRRASGAERLSVVSTSGGAAAITSIVAPTGT